MQFQIYPVITFITLGTNRHYMPAITASLSETGYEGYKSIPKGMRSKMIDKMLRDFALKKVHVYREMEGQVSMQEILDREKYYKHTIKTLYQQLEEAGQ